MLMRPADGFVPWVTRANDHLDSSKSPPRPPGLSVWKVSQKASCGSWHWSGTIVPVPIDIDVGGVAAVVVDVEDGGGVCVTVGVVGLHAVSAPRSASAKNSPKAGRVTRRREIFDFEEFLEVIAAMLPLPKSRLVDSPETWDGLVQAAGLFVAISTRADTAL